MNYRERVIGVVTNKKVDSLPVRHAFGLMPEVLEQWYREGLPRWVATPEDIIKYFKFPGKGERLSINTGFIPAFETKVIEENEEYKIAIDSMNRKTKVLKKYASIPLALEYPVSDIDSWQDYKQRLQFYPDRISEHLEKNVAQNLESGSLNNFGTQGFYWFPRDLMGDESLCVAFYEQPELIHDIQETRCQMLEQVLNKVLQRVQLDGIHFGEDMAYKNASMVSKSVFDEFIAPYYKRIHKLVEKYNVPVFSVDTDGCINELIHWFAEVGVNMIGPNEVQADNDIVKYRQELGPGMAYFGGLEKQTLTQGRAAIDRMLEEKVPIMKKLGGWIISLDHRVVKGTKLTDFQYYLDQVREMAKY